MPVSARDVVLPSGTGLGAIRALGRSHEVPRDPRNIHAAPRGISTWRPAAASRPALGPAPPRRRKREHLPAPPPAFGDLAEDFEAFSMRARIDAPTLSGVSVELSGPF